jgi:hypothetical protein
LGFRARGISPVRGAPRWRTSSGEERRCGAGGVVGAGVRRVIEVHQRVVELEEATVGQRGGRRGGARWAPAVLIFSQITQTGSNLEIKNGCLILLKKIRNFFMLLGWGTINNYLNVPISNSQRN